MLDETQSAQGGSMYDLTLILAKDSDEKSVFEVIASHGAEVSDQKDLGVKTFVFPIAKATEGKYLSAMIEIEPAKLQELDKALQDEKSVIRHLIVMPLRQTQAITRADREKATAEAEKAAGIVRTEKTSFDKAQDALEGAEVKPAELPATEEDVKEVVTEAEEAKEEIKTEPVVEAKEEVKVEKTEKVETPKTKEPAKAAAAPEKPKKRAKAQKVSVDELDKKLKELVDEI